MPGHHPTTLESPVGPSSEGIRDFDRLRVRSIPSAPTFLSPDDDGSHPVLLIWFRGGGMLRQNGGSVAVPPGSLCFLSNDAPVWLCDVGAAGAVIVELPREIETRARGRISVVLGAIIDTDTGAAAFLRSFLDTLESQPPSYRPDHPGWVQNCLGEITERVVAERAGTQPSPAQRVVITAQSYALAHLTEPDLTPNGVARAASVSLRTLNRLFAADGDSVCGWIRRQRLERCRDDLLDPVMDDRSISQIGAGWGFVDAAHFSRIFKDAFGCSPRTFRAAAADPCRTIAESVHRVA